MRVLTISSLYPNAVQPNHGVFVENRLRRVSETGVSIHIIAPLPWFPSTNRHFGRYAAFAKVPSTEHRHGLQIDHPRYFMAPKMAYWGQPESYYRAIKKHILRLIAETGPFDLIDAHYFYPDGVAAARLATDLDLPLMITARGSDISQIPLESNRARIKIQHSIQRANHIGTVCEALREALIDLGSPAERTTTLRNGVDLNNFRPLNANERELQRDLWNIAPHERLCVSVGGLVERKGHHLTIEAVAALPNIRLLIAGTGPEQQTLQTQIDRLGASHKIRLLGAINHNALYQLYGAADMSILASSREGWANVLLESMACGTPVIATPIWGTPEVVQDPCAGRLTKDRSVEEIASAIGLISADPPNREETRQYAEKFGWQETIEGVLECFSAAIKHHAHETKGTRTGKH